MPDNPPPQPAAAHDTLVCCRTVLPWPTAGQDSTCPDCGTVWECEPPERPAGARIKSQPDWESEILAPGGDLSPGHERLLADLHDTLAATDPASIDRDYPGWHGWASDAGRFYASLTTKPGPRTLCGELLDADSLEELRELLKARTS